jgi:hypothetical protein
MFGKNLSLIAIVCTIFACNLQAVQYHETWVGGAQGFWQNCNNWDPPIYEGGPLANYCWPDNFTNTFAVTISGDVNITVGNSPLSHGLLPRGAYVIDRLDCYGNVRLLSGSLILEDPVGLRNHGYLTIDQMKIYGNLDNPEGCIIASDRDVEIEAGELENGGLIVITPTSRLLVAQVHNAGQINIYGGQCIGNEVFDNDITGSISGFGYLLTHNRELFYNKGKIYAFGGSLVVITEGLLNIGIIGNAPLASVNVMHMVPLQYLSNLGTIEVNAGGGVAFDCNVVNQPNAFIKLHGGTLASQKITQKSGATLQGFGGITGNVVIDPDGIIKLTGPTNIVGNVEIKNDATLEVSDGLTLITGQTTCNGTIHIKGGYLIPQGGLSGNCNIIWEPGLYTNVADFNLDGQVNLKDFAYFADTWLWQIAWR